MQNTLSLFERSLILNRYPVRKKETLQAWDAADEYLIKHFCSEIQINAEQSILIIGDNFGALSAWFAPISRVCMVSDSFIAHQATRQNITRNKLPTVDLITPLHKLPDADFCIMRLPKNKRLLIWYLIRLCQQMPDGATIITAAKAKDIHSTTLTLFEQYLGTTRTSLAQKKARLIFTQVDKSRAQELPKPLQWHVPKHKLTLTNHANVFSGESLDIGARFMLEHIPQDTSLSRIIDLGCGNGILGIKAAQLNAQAQITCVDESFMAVASTKANADINLGNNHHLTAVANDALTGFEKNSADLILCNPPFHQQNTITDHIAWQMFQDAYNTLKPGGKLRVIGNSHLKYQQKLKRIFGQYSVVASNKKFLIIEVEK